MNTFYRQEGNGKTILLLHGWGGNNFSFAPVFNSLKKHFKVIALDFWGFGKSQKPPTSVGVNWYAYQTKTFLDLIGIKKTDIIAHSFGGRVALVLSSQFSTYTDKLVLCDSAGLKPKFSFKRMFKIYLYKFKKFLAKFKLIKKQSLANCGSKDYQQLDDNMKGTFVKVVNQNLKKEAKNTKAQTLLVWGSGDRDTPLYMAKKFNKFIKNSGLVILKDAGHFCYLDNFFAFDKIVKSFLGVV